MDFVPAEMQTQARKEQYLFIIINPVKVFERGYSLDDERNLQMSSGEGERTCKILCGTDCW